MARPSKNTVRGGGVAPTVHDLGEVGTITQKKIELPEPETPQALEQEDESSLTHHEIANHPKFDKFKKEKGQ